VERENGKWWRNFKDQRQEKSNDRNKAGETSNFKLQTSEISKSKRPGIVRLDFLFPVGPQNELWQVLNTHRSVKFGV
jgi:hypothetical protein